MKNSLIASFVLVLALSFAAHAKSVPGPAGSQVSIEVPDNFKSQGAEKDGEGVMVALSPKEDCMFLWALAKVENFDKATAALDGVLGKFVKDVKVDKAAKSTVNGMPAVAISGSGTVEGKAATLAVVIVQTTPKTALLTIGIVETANKAAYKDTLKKVLAGIRPTK